MAGTNPSTDPGVSAGATAAGMAPPLPVTPSPQAPAASIDELLARRAPAPENAAAPADIDEFMSRYAPQPPNSYVLAEGGGVMQGDQWDSLFTGDTPGARILDAMGAGAKHAWGALPIDWDEKTIDYLKKSGVFQDALATILGPAQSVSRALGSTTGSSFIKGYNEAMLRPLAWAMGTAEVAYRDIAAAQEGAAAGVYQTGQELQNVPVIGALAPGELAREIAGSIQTGGPFAGAPGMLRMHVPEPPTPFSAASEANREAVSALNPERLRPGNLAVEPAPRGEVTIESIEARALGKPFRPASIPEARSLAAIGESDGGYFDLTTPTPEVQAERDAAIAAIPSEPPTVPAITPDIQSAARAANPDLFAEFDATGLRADALRRQIDDLQAQREQQSSPEIAALDQRLGDLRQMQGQEPATTAAGRQLRRQITAAVNDRQRLVDALPETGDTAEMAAARQQLLAETHRMWDLSPQVREAYRTASEAMPAAEATPPEVAPEPQPAPEATTPATPAAGTAPGAPAPPAAPPLSMPIAQDVARQLMAAGRPAEEADAVGAIQAARYAARSANLEGTTPEQLYAEEAPTIEAGPGAKRGAITISDARSTIRLLGRADASTAIHELGHSWFEELTRDAADDRATPAVKADADTVQKWLGVDEGASPSRAQHEKFARGVERYMMEGRAPTQALAGVFAKFKTWLTNIYQTVGRLRSPISDDIRRVFDRMLTAPERTLITPEAEAADFAARHEAIAERTPANEAAAAADHITDEANDIAAERSPEIHAELTSTGEPGPGGGAGGEPGAGQQPDRDAVAAGAVGGEPAAPGPARAVGAGGGEVAPAGARSTTATTTAERPATDIPRTDTRLVDKAGNIRLDNINSPEEWKEALRQAAERNADFTERRRGVVTDAQRNALANVLGTTPDRVFTKEIGESFTDSEIKLLEKTLAESTAHVTELGAKAIETGSDADIATATAALLRHDMIQGLYSQATAEAGRSLRALRRSQEFWTAATTQQSGMLRQSLQDATGRTPEQMLQLFQKLTAFDQAGPANKFLRDAMKPGLFDWIQAAWTNGILSNPFTHATYWAAGQVFALYRQFWATPFQSAVGAARYAFDMLRGRPTTAPYASIRMVAPEVHGYLFGSIDGMRAAYTAIKENQQIIPAEVTALRKEAGQMAQQGAGIIPNPTIAGREIPIGKTLEMPMRMVSALHSFNWTAFYRQGLGRLAFQTAQNEGLIPGTQDFAKRLADLTQNPTKGIIEEASKYADAGALVTRAPYDSVIGAASRLLHRGRYFEPLKVPGTKLEIPLGTFRPGMYVDPFVQIQGNILRTAYMNGTPLEAFTGAARDDLMMRNGGLAFDLRAGRILAGTTLMLGAGGLYYLGHLNDSGPSDPVKAYWWRRTHGMPHGLNIGHLSFDVLRLGTIGMQISVAADLAKIAGDVGHGEFSQAAADLVHAVSQNIIDESAFSGPQRMLEAINNNDRYGAAWIRQFASSLIPYSGLARGTTHMIDPYTRRVRSTVDAMKAIIPGESETLYPRYDFWGQPEPNRGWLLSNYEHLRNDPVDLKLQSLGITPRMPQQWIRGVALTEQQYADYSREAGRLARQQVENTLKEPGFDDRPPGVQIDMIDKAVARGHRVAANRIIQQSRLSGDNSILDIAAERKRAHRETGAPIREPAR